MQILKNVISALRRATAKTPPPEPISSCKTETILPAEDAPDILDEITPEEQEFLDSFDITIEYEERYKAKARRKNPLVRLENDPLPDDWIGLAIGIRYKDSKGALSDRRIRINDMALKSNGDVKMRCYCFERKAARTFMLSNIQHIFDLQTGEIHDDPVAYFEDIFGISLNIEAECATLKAIKNRKKTVDLLVYTARCDGHFHEKEIEAVIDFLVTAERADIDRQKAKNYMKNLYPSFESYLSALDHTLQLDPMPQKRAIKYLHHVINADGKLSEEEFEVLKDIQELAECL